MGVETVFYTIKKGKVIVRKGDEVTAEAAKQIRLINLEPQPQAELVHEFRRDVPPLRPPLHHPLVLPEIHPQVRKTPSRSSS